MRITINNNTTNKPVIGYIKQIATPELYLQSKVQNGIIYNKSYIFPSMNRKLISDNVNMNTTIFLPSNEPLYIYTNIPSGTMSIKYYFIDTTTSTVLYNIHRTGTGFGHCTINTPANIKYALIKFNTTNTAAKFAIYRSGIIYKGTSLNYIYKYTAKNKAYYSAELNNAYIVDDYGNIQDYDSYEIIYDTDYTLTVYGDKLNDEKLFLVYDIYEDGEVLNYREPIDPIQALDITLNEIEYGMLKDKPILSISNRNSFVPSMTMILGTNMPIYQIDEHGTVKTYSTNDAYSYLYSRAGVPNFKYTKIKKEKVTFIGYNKQIKVNWPIRLDNSTQKPPNMYDIDYDFMSTYTGNNTGLNIYIGGKLLNNNRIKYIHQDEGIIELYDTPNTESIYVSYTTDPLVNYGTLSEMNITTSQNFFVFNNNNYNMICENIDSFITETLIEATQTGKIYNNYIEALTEQEYNITTYNNYLVVNLAHKSTGDITVSINDIEGNTLASDTISLTGTLQYDQLTFDISSYDNDLVLNINPAGTTELHDIQIYTITETPEQGIYYTSTPNLTNNVTLHALNGGSDIAFDSSYDYVVIASMKIQSLTNNQLYQLIDINKRGGGLEEDNIINDMTGYNRRDIFPLSYDYGDIANKNNMPFNEKKVLIFKLPLTLIDTYITKLQTIEMAKSENELRQEVINTIYQKIRSYVSGGTYFKIYDMDDNEWPKERLI